MVDVGTWGIGWRGEDQIAPEMREEAGGGGWQSLVDNAETVLGRN
jgi:hypothetical protein